MDITAWFLRIGSITMHTKEIFWPHVVHRGFTQIIFMIIHRQMEIRLHTKVFKTELVETSFFPTHNDTNSKSRLSTKGLFRNVSIVKRRSSENYSVFFFIVNLKKISVHPQFDITNTCPLFSKSNKDQ